MKCPKCGDESPEELRVCRRCWSRLVAPREPNWDTAGGHDDTDEARPRGPLFGVPYVEEFTRVDSADSLLDVPSFGVLATQESMFRGDRDMSPPGVVDGDSGPSSRAVLSFVLGLLSVVFFCMFFLTIPIDLTALVLGLLELRDINAGERPQAGRGFAVAGVVLSAAALVFKIFLLLAV